MIKKILLLALLFAVIQLCYGKDKFIPATCYDCDMQTLVQKLKSENRPAEKINILNGLILYNVATDNDPATTDTNYVKQLIANLWKN